MTSNKCFALKGMKILSIGFFIIIIIASCNANSNSSSEDKKGTALTKPTEKIKTSPAENIGLRTTGSWTKKEKENWLKPCLQGLTIFYGEEGAKKTCDCMLVKMQERHKVYSEVDNTDPQESTKLMEECMDIKLDKLLEK